MVPMGELSEEDQEEALEEAESLETYRFMKAAQWMNVPPWELLEREPWWAGIGWACFEAEKAGEKYHIEKNKPKKK